MQVKMKSVIKRTVDIVLTVLLLFLMAFQVTGDKLHEWLGIGMTALLILHHLLNSKWYGAVFKGKYTLYRIMLTLVNTLLLASIAAAAFSGMAMSNHAVPFMYGIIRPVKARKLHLAMSYWSFILMGVHIGFHMKAMTARLGNRGKIVFKVVLTAVSGIGLRLFLKSGIADYIFFRTHFAFLDFNAPKWRIILENLAMLLFWLLVGTTIAELTQKNRNRRYSLMPLIWLTAAVAFGTALNIAFKDGSSDTGASGWQNSRKPAKTYNKQSVTEAASVQQETGDSQH